MQTPLAASQPPFLVAQLLMGKQVVFEVVYPVGHPQLLMQCPVDVHVRFPGQLLAIEHELMVAGEYVRKAMSSPERPLHEPRQYLPPGYGFASLYPTPHPPVPEQSSPIEYCVPATTSTGTERVKLKNAPLSLRTYVDGAEPRRGPVRPTPK